jgi:ABC-type branched-subunit amino acid transport system substrate-binding protein
VNSTKHTSGINNSWWEKILPPFSSFASLTGISLVTDFNKFRSRGTSVDTLKVLYQETLGALLNIHRFCSVRVYGFIVVSCSVPPDFFHDSSLTFVTGLGCSLFRGLIIGLEGSGNMRKTVSIALIVLVAILPIFAANQVFATDLSISPPLLAAQAQKKAVILDSLEQVYPMGLYGKLIVGQLQSAGYQVTVLRNGNVTLDFLVNQLNNYSLILWRTDSYTWQHREFWYVGQLANSAVQAEYASDFAQGWINGNGGIMGVSLNFIMEHFPANSLTNVKLMLLIATDSNVFGPVFDTAGAKAIVYCNGEVSLSFSLIDDLAGMLMSYLVQGQTVYNAVYNTVSPFVQNTQTEDPLDSSYAPPFWFAGDPNLVIT